MSYQHLESMERKKTWAEKMKENQGSGGAGASTNGAAAANTNGKSTTNGAGAASNTNNGAVAGKSK